MSKLPRLLVLFIVASLLLTACGAPAIVREEDHTHEEGETAHGADEAAAEDEHTDEAAAEDEHTDEAAGEDEHADEATAEDEHTDEAAAEDEHTDEAAGEDEHADEAAGEDEHTDEAAAEDEHTDEHTDEAAPEDPVAAVEAVTGLAGDPANGEALFNTFYDEIGFACATCHRVDSEERLIGPGLLNVAIHGGAHVEGLTVAEYIYQSIIEPNAYVVETFPENLMPQVYAEKFSEQEISDIMVYVLSLVE